MGKESEELSFREVEATPIRKIIAKRMVESKTTIPHFYLTLDIDMQRMIDFRSRLNRQGEIKISYNDLIIKAAAEILKDHPECNVSYIDNRLRYYKNVNISLAVAVEGGLLTPTVHECEKKSIREINREVTELIEKARRIRLRLREQTGGTFTLSNLGMFGIEEFYAIVNPPQAMILAVGAIRDVPVVSDGKIVAGKRMKASLSCDHRAVDGAIGAMFLSELKNIIEDPEAFLADRV